MNDRGARANRRPGASRLDADSPAVRAIASALDGGDPGAHYDRRAAVYDRLVASRLYNRLLWGTSPASYRAFVAEAVADAGGPLLEVACGSAALSAGAYAATTRPVQLVDRSRAILERAAARIGIAPHIALLQADLFALPFAPRGFDTVLAVGSSTFSTTCRPPPPLWRATLEGASS